MAARVAASMVGSRPSDPGGGCDDDDDATLLLLEEEGPIPPKPTPVPPFKPFSPPISMKRPTARSRSFPAISKYWRAASSEEEEVNARKEAI